MFPTMETRRDSIDKTAATVVLSSEGGEMPQSFTQAAPNEPKLGKGGKVVRARHRLGGGVGGGETGTREKDSITGGPVVDLQPNWTAIHLSKI